MFLRSTCSLYRKGSVESLGRYWKHISKDRSKTQANFDIHCRIYTKKFAGKKNQLCLCSQDMC
jgi:hypothetical protein